MLVSELDISITPEVEPRDLDESQEAISQELCNEVTEPTILDLDNDILSIEYESFSYGFDVSMVLDVDLCAEYESFSLEPIQPDFLFESHKSKFIESEAIVTEHFDLDQNPAHITLKGLVDLGLTNLPSPFIYDHVLSRLMTHLLADFKYAHLFSDWAQLFDKLKRALTCATLIRWMYFTWC